MLRDIFGGRSRSTLVYDARDEVVKMVRRSERMFAAACDALLKGSAADDSVRLEDREIHAEERLARRLILEHLMINPDQDLSASLALLSVVHDAERLGDYAKHLLDLQRWEEFRSPECPYASTCGDLHERIKVIFAKTISALQDDNPELAREAMQAHTEAKPLTDTVLEDVMSNPVVNREAVLYVLASRFLRRISAHLSNIASSVVNPLDQVTHNEAI
jgi:phosphate transport system protein